jgi:hypothetical protein
MNPVKFKESNVTLNKPESMTDEECILLPVFTDGVQCISCWNMTFKERIKALMFGKIWLYVYSGKTQPPVWLIADKTIFQK